LKHAKFVVSNEQISTVEMRVQMSSQHWAELGDLLSNKVHFSFM